MPKRSEPTVETAGDWRTALADASQRSQDIRREAVVRDVSRWVETCRRIASGQEPDGATLAEIAEIADRLSLPYSALSDDVAAIVEHRRLIEKAGKKRAEREALEAQAPELREALANAKKEVERITLLLRRIQSLTGSEVAITHSASKVQAKNPRLFNQADSVADVIIGQRSQLSSQHFNTGAMS